MIRVQSRKPDQADPRHTPAYPAAEHSHPRLAAINATPNAPPPCPPCLCVSPTAPPRASPSSRVANTRKPGGCNATTQRPTARYRIALAANPERHSGSVTNSRSSRPTAIAVSPPRSLLPDRPNMTRAEEAAEICHVSDWITQSVGVIGFEPTTLWSQTRCASQTALHSVKGRL